MRATAQGAGEAADVADVGLDDVDRPRPRPSAATATGSSPARRRPRPGRAPRRPRPSTRAPSTGTAPRSARRPTPRGTGRPRSRGPACSSCSRRRAARASSPSARRTAGTIASVRPGHSSRSWPHSLPTRNLKAPKPCSVAQPCEALGLVLRRDVAAHARGVGRERPRGAARERAHRLPFRRAAQVPERGVDAGQRAADVRAGVLVLGLEDARRPRAARCRPGRAEDVRRDLAVQHLGGDVGVVRRDLAPALGAVVGRHAHEPDPLVGEALDARDPVAGRRSQHDHVSDRLAAAHGVDRLVDPLERIGGRDELVELEPPAQVEAGERGMSSAGCDEPSLLPRMRLPSCARAPASKWAGCPFGGMPTQHERAAAAQARQPLVDRGGGAGGDEDGVGAGARRLGADAARPDRPRTRRSRGGRAEAPPRPRASPARRRRAITGAAPRSAAPWTAFRPTPPAPITTTSRRAPTRASLTTAPMPVMTRAGDQAGARVRDAGGIATACDACTTDLLGEGAAAQALDGARAAGEPDRGLARRAGTAPRTGPAAPSRQRAQSPQLRTRLTTTSLAGPRLRDARPGLDDDAAGLVAEHRRQRPAPGAVA